MALTSKRVAKLLRRGEPRRHLDGRGLYLVINSPTSAYWEKRYQFLGRERHHGLGSARTFSLVEARERNRRASQLIADGRDPLVVKRESKAQQIVDAAKTITFGEVALQYFQAHAPTWRHPKHIAQWRASVLGLTPTGPAKPDYCKSLRVLPITAIDTPLILHVLRPLWQDKPETMSRVRARIAAVLDFGKAAGYRSGDNPAAQSVIGKLLPGRGKVEHYAAIDYRDLPGFVQQLREHEGTAARALEFLIHTAARSSEVRMAVWNEISFDEALWVIPANKMKAGKEHRVPLAPEAIELLRGLPREGDGADGLVFLGLQPGSGLSSMALAAVLRRMGHGHVTVHGFRSSFRDWAAECTNYPNHVVEMALAHAVGNAVEAAYRRGDLLVKRRHLAEAWAKYCTSPPASGATVMSIGRR
jgi:integrase